MHRCDMDIKPSDLHGDCSTQSLKQGCFCWGHITALCSSNNQSNYYSDSTVTPELTSGVHFKRYLSNCAIKHTRIGNCFFPNVSFASVNVFWVIQDNFQGILNQIIGNCLFYYYSANTVSYFLYYRMDYILYFNFFYKVNYSYNVLLPLFS